MHISLSPNTQGDDIRLAWRTLWNDQAWRAQALHRLTQDIASYYPSRHVLLASSARSALTHLLAALGIGQGDEVILQAFTCIASPAPLIWQGVTPVYADINPATYNLDSEDVARKITPKTKAVIIQHTFGIPGPIREIAALCQSRNLLLIEDCAHALGATWQNQPLGTFGDAAILSFGRDKVISSVYGGAILIKDDAAYAKAQQIVAGLLQPPNTWIYQQLLHPILVNTYLPLYNFLSLGKALLAGSQSAGALSLAVTAAEKQGAKPDHVEYAYAPALATLLANQWSKLNRYVQIRQQHAAFYQQKLAGFAHALPQVPADSAPGWLRFPLRVKKSAALFSAAKAKQLVLGDWYTNPLAPAGCDLSAFGYTAGMCPKAEDASRHIINLPTHPRLTIGERQRVVDVLLSNQHLI